MLLKVVNLTLGKLLDHGYKISHVHHGSAKTQFKVSVNNEFFGQLVIYDLKSAMDALTVCSFLFMESQYKTPKEEIVKILEKEGLVLMNMSGEIQHDSKHH